MNVEEGNEQIKKGKGNRNRERKTNRCSKSRRISMNYDIKQTENYSKNK